MKAYLDIENAKTKEVITVTLDVIKSDIDNIIFDISNLNSKEMKLISDAINKELTYTDIELFFIDEDKLPYFGPDYNYIINDNKLILNKIIKSRINKNDKNPDWTIKYNEEFKKIALDFINSDKEYLLIYYDNSLKGKFLNIEDTKDIFIKLYIDYNYHNFALFKRIDNKVDKDVRSCLEYIDSYLEDDI